MGEFTKKFPFLTVGVANGERIIGLIKISNSQYVSLYVLNGLSMLERNRIIDIGDRWWWNSNRQIPASIFLFSELEQYEYTVKRFFASDFEWISGPMISLGDLPTKRIKRSTTILSKP